MRILFVKLGAIGDALMARGLPAEAKRRYPAARFTWLAGRSVAPLVRLFPGVDELLEADDAALLAGPPAARARALLQALALTAGRRYDLVLTGHADRRYRLLAALSWAGRRRAFGPGFPRPGRYHGHEYLRLLEGRELPGGAPAFSPLAAPPLGAELDAELAAAGPGLLLFPGGARNLLRDDALRRWPLEHYARLGRLALERGLRVWLGGSASDAWVRPAFAGLPHLDLIGRLSLPQSLALCARASAVVAHDSGPLHLAQAAGARALGLFGPTAPSEKLDPASRASALWGGAGLACRPCYDGRAYPACPANACLASLSPEAALAALEL